MRQEQEKYPHRNSYLIYTRKSTDDKDNQKNSHVYQKIEILRFVQREHLPIASLDIESFCTDGIISESDSGFKEDEDFEVGDGYIKYKVHRPKFHQLVQLLNKGEIKGAIFLSWDRASRNKNDSNILDKLINKGVDIRFALATYDNTSSGKMHRGFDGMIAEQHSLVTSEKIRLATRKLRAEGVCTYRAPVGYLNLKTPYDKPFDEKRAPLVKELFEKCGEGRWSLIDLARWANKCGLTMPPSRRRRTTAEMLTTDENPEEIKPVERAFRVNNVQWVLRNQFYIGKVRGNDDTWTQSASHKPLVDEALFWRVQNILTKRKVSVHYTEKLAFPYRGMIRCFHCDRVYTPYAKKDVVYYGARCRTGCENTMRSINSEFVEEKISETLRKLYYSKEELAEIDTRMKTISTIWEEERQRKVKDAQSRAHHTREEMAYFHTHKLSLLRTRVYSPEQCLAEEARLQKALEEAQAEEKAADINIHTAVKDVIRLSEILEDTYLYYSLANSSEKALIAQKVFSEIRFSEKTYDYKYRNGFKVLNLHDELYCDPGRNRTYISNSASYRPIH